MKKSLSVLTLALFITGSIDSIRNLPAAAMFGSQLPFFFLLAALFFLIPTGLVAAQLSSDHRLSGGVYGWISAAFGQKIGVVAVWLQWVNTMVWYPTILSFIAGTIAYLIDPALASQPHYLFTVIVLTFWLQTIINLFGVQVSAVLAAICTIIGMLIPMAIIVFLAVIWLFGGHTSEIVLTAHSMVPKFSASESWISLTAIVTAFLGMELAAVHVKDIEQANKRFPIALILSVIVIVTTMLAGSLSIAMVLPVSKMHLVDGVMQTFSLFFHHYHLGWLTDICAIMLLTGSLGGMINWIISPAKGLFLMGEAGYLPKKLLKQNRYGVASHILVLQALMVTVISALFLYFPSVNAAYWLLTDLSTQLYMLMYLLLFVAAYWLHRKGKLSEANFQLPGNWGLPLFAAMGFIGSAFTFFVGFLPPENIPFGAPGWFDVCLLIGMLAMLIPVGMLLWWRKKHSVCYTDRKSKCEIATSRVL